MKKVFITLIIIVLLTACSFLEPLFISEKKVSEPVLVEEEKALPEEEPLDPKIIEMKKYLKAYQFGKNLIENEQFNDLITWIPESYINNPTYLLRIDLLPLGNKISILDEYDAALEEGMHKGLIDRNFIVYEKLDDINLREFNEYLNTVPENAFYMHSINLPDLEKIQDKFNISQILTYQILSIDYRNETAFIYFRLIDLKSKKIISSTAVQMGMKKSDISNQYGEIYNAIKKHQFPPELFSKLHNTTFINVDAINIGGNSSKAMSEKMISLENGIISGMIHIGPTEDYKPFINEKTQGYLYKYPGVYKNIVFNTNPILCETWKEFVNNTGCTELAMYRYISDESLYLRIIDTKNNGFIIYSDVIGTNDKEKNDVIRVYNEVKIKFTDSFPWQKMLGSKLIIINGNEISDQTNTITAKKIREVQLAIEEGILSALTENKIPYDIKIYEKLATLYLKRPYMLDGKAFNLNPLYLNSWQDLETLGADFILIYNNLLDYKKQNNKETSGKVALNYRIIDVQSGQIIFSDILSNI